jgi:hypothetical protein
MEDDEADERHGTTECALVCIFHLDLGAPYSACDSERSASGEVQLVT